MTGVHPAPCHDEFRGYGSDAVEIRWHKKQQQQPEIPHTKIVELVWETLSPPAYTPDIALFDCHLFMSLQNFLDGKKYTNYEVCDDRFGLLPRYSFLDRKVPSSNPPSLMTLAVQKNRSSREAIYPPQRQRSRQTRNTTNRAVTHE
ncbi:hypothetical protein TNCV_907281 [Trichonephila clavipes]|nr:hypothetical protein TNCV_907281 [Trichonephila clavipes]